MHDFRVTIPVILVVYFGRALRTSIELVLVGGLLMADAVLAVANAGSGIERMLYYSRGTENAMLPIRKCYFSPYVFMFAFSYQTIGLMTLAVSLERFFAVFYPLIYVKYTRFHGYGIIVAVIVFSAGTYLLAIPSHINLETPVSAFCFATTTLNPGFMKGLRLLRFATVTLSIAVYVPVIVRVYDVLSVPSLSNDSNKIRQVARLSVTIGFTSLAALLFLLIPDAIIVFDLFGLKQFHVLSYSVNLFKGLFNLVLYSTKHKVLRISLKRALCCWKSNRLGSWVS